MATEGYSELFIDYRSSMRRKSTAECWLQRGDPGWSRFLFRDWSIIFVCKKALGLHTGMGPCRHSCLNNFFVPGLVAE